MTPASFAGLQYELIAPKTGRLVEHNLTDPGPNQLLMRVQVNGVCASDLATWANEQSRYPIVLGHEPVGQVLATGPGVAIPIGTWVTGRIFPSFSQYAIADVEDVATVPTGVEPLTALGEPLGCVAEGFRRTPVQLGDRVAVIGLGFMGLLMLQMLADSAQSELVGIDLRDDARHHALQLGATTTCSPSNIPDRYFADDSLDLASPNNGFDVVIEATGSQPGLDLATRLVRAHGILSILGYHQGKRNVDMGAWNRKALDVVNAHVRDRSLLRESTRRGLDMLAAKRVDLDQLITHRFSLASVDAALETLESKPEGFIKAIIMAD